MTRVRNMLLAVGTLATLATTASAQYTFPTFNFGTTNSTWRAIDLDVSSVPAGSYSSYLVVYNWGGSTSSSHWSNDTRMALTENTRSGGDRASDPLGTGAVFARPAVAATNATGSTPGSNPSTVNAYWNGTLSSLYTGGNPLRFQMGGYTSGLGTANNVHVTLNPTVSISRSFAGVAAPTSFIDIGNVTPNAFGEYHSPAVTTSASNRVQWFRFNLTAPVSSSEFLDMDTFGNANSSSTAFDTEINFFYNRTGTLQFLGSDDDDANGTLSLMTFGSASTGANGRPFANTPNSPGYNGRDSSALPSFMGGTLLAGEYFVAVSHYTASASGTVPTGTVALNGTLDGLTGTEVYTSTFSLPTTYGTTQFNLYSIPAPGFAALFGMGTLMAARRRRA